MSRNVVEKLRKISGVEKVGSNFEQDFYKKLKSLENIKKQAFENNFPYILQSLRGDGLVYSKYDTYIFFGSRSLDEGEVITIVNILGKNKAKILNDFIPLIKSLNLPIILKNVEEEDIPFLKELGFKKREARWSNYSIADDNTFPQYYVDRRALDLYNYDRNTRRILRKIDRTRDIQIIDFLKCKSEHTRKMLESNAEFLQNKGVDSASEVMDAHEFFFDEEIKNKFRFLHIENDNIIAASYLSYIPEGNVAYYNAVFNKKENNLMKYILYSGLRNVFKHNNEIEYISWQGSENSGQDFMKRRFKPYFEIKKNHMELRP